MKYTKTKRVIFFFLVAVLLFLTACGSDVVSTDLGTQPETTEPTQLATERQTEPPTTAATEETAEPTTEPETEPATQETTYAAQPPATEPPATQPPETNPPQTDPLPTNPPETDPPQTQPPTTPPETDPPETDPPVSGDVYNYVLNTNTMKFHYSHCGSADKIKPENKSYFTGTRDELIAMGYSPCGNCDP